MVANITLGSAYLNGETCAKTDAPKHATPAKYTGHPTTKRAV